MKSQGDGVDWYQFDSPAGTLAFSMTAVAVQPNATGTETYDVVTAGDYFVKVFRAGDPNTTSGAIKLDYTLDLDTAEAEVRGPDTPGENIARGLH